MLQSTQVATPANFLFGTDKSTRPRAAKPEPATDTKKVRILSIDGGGIRGIIPATILTYVEDRLQVMSGNDDARLCDYFDMMAGTSTGGILNCTYLTPVDSTDQQPRPMTAATALDLYKVHGPSIFSQPFNRKLETLFGIIDEKYSATNIEKLLKKYFGAHTRLSEMLKPCMITSYDITQRKAVFFNPLSARKHPSRNYKIWEVARATSAAPTYFEPANVCSDIGCFAPLIDGGLFANNPAMCAFIEAHKTRFSSLDACRNMPDHPLCSEVLLVSIGTGSVKRSYDYNHMKNQGAIGWVKPVIDIMMSASAETVDFQLKQMFDTCQQQMDAAQSNYLRMSPDLGSADPAMDNTRPENLEALHQAGLQYVTQHKGELDKLVDRLLEQ